MPQHIGPSIPQELCDKARDALRKLGHVIRTNEEAARRELAAEARLAWLYSLLPMHDTEQLAKTLAFVHDLVQRLDVWADGTAPRAWPDKVAAENFEREVLKPVIDAADLALEAVNAAVDAYRLSFSEGMR